MKQKIIIFIAMLVISTTILPVIDSRIIKIEEFRKNAQQDVKTVDVILRQYSSNGMTEIREKISLSLAREISSKLQESKNIKEKLGLLKKYGLISKVLSIDNMREEANKIAGRYNLLDKKMIKALESLDSGGRIKVCISRIINAEGSGAIVFLPIGLSAITGFINGILLLLLTHFFIPIPSIDIAVGMYAGESSSPLIKDGNILLGIGLLPRYFEGGAGSWFFSFGFIGITIYLGLPGLGYADIMGFVPFAVAYLTPS